MDQQHLFEMQEDWEEHWQGMPAFDNPGLETWTISVHFRSQADRQRFAELLGQTITPLTKYLWWPAEDHDTPRERAVVDGSEISDLCDQQGSLGESADSKGSGVDAGPLSSGGGASGAS